VHSSITDDEEELLMSGMNVTTEFQAGKLDNVLLVPTVCVISERGKTGVLVPGEDGDPVFRKIKSGRTAGNKTQVLSGLEDGDEVFTALSSEQLKERGYSKTPKSRRGRRMGLPRSHR